MGRIAGESAARYATDGKRITTQKNDRDLDEPGEAELQNSPVSLREIRRHIRDLAWEHAGIVRDEGGIIEGFRKLHGLEQDLKGASWSNVIDRAMKEDLLSAVFSLKAILSASTGRKESRGSFIRKDFPREDNANWRKNSCLTYDAKKDSFSVTYHEVK